MRLLDDTILEMFIPIRNWFTYEVLQYFHGDSRPRARIVGDEAEQYFLRFFRRIVVPNGLIFQMYHFISHGLQIAKPLPYSFRFHGWYGKYCWQHMAELI